MQVLSIKKLTKKNQSIAGTHIHWWSRNENLVNFSIIVMSAIYR